MKSFLNNIKKNNLFYIISSITAVIMALLLIRYDLGFPIFVIFIILPFTYGMLFVLIQDKNRSYQFIPKLFWWSLVTSFLVSLFFQATSFLFIFNLHGLNKILEITLILFIISIPGGLVGLVIRGITLLIQKK